MVDVISDIVGRIGVSRRLDLFEIRRYFMALLDVEPFEKAFSNAEIVEKIQHLVYFRERWFYINFSASLKM